VANPAVSRFDRHRQEFAPVHPWTQASRPLVFAHRGGSRLAPENTLAAFDRATAEGVDGLELDVHLSADGEVVVCHDAHVDRTTDSRGPIAGMTARELAGVDAAFRFADEHGRRAFRGQGYGIPMLREVLARYPDVRLIVELKDGEQRLAREVLRVVTEGRAVGRVCLGSFHGPALQAIRSLEPAVATSAGQLEVRLALYRSWIGLFPRAVPYQAFQVPERRERIRVVSPRFVRGAHRAGVAVQVWVVDEVEDIRRLLGWGADAIITDRPDVAVPAVRAWADEVRPR
jgi:glycerophosphoryl diester phosphodiesterase